ncbi:putative isoamyl alcohol oxidase [Aspergillus clavatus NRRL 1]|uniref:FAD binding domain protein n=1 Tax=Aspergillus clavatus (strain ATCC 1007 / CBS 513.65 / DSM 816 / NCTC 3887 / NRRL 1 / QM 1276 / 107) TaxID=344612 RepID=A1CSF1_ASPCL|nr:FAD binding domain protein [Aspergillus clavatus NRRL 1]EAW08572.1 FAD binding domain protein [Aspergillus clavatus NRRL 1]
MKISWTLATAVAALSSTAAAWGTPRCRCLPGDSCWPSQSSWDALNSTVGGRLIATVPLGSPCHDPTYDADACKALQADWNLPETHLSSSSSIMQTYFANQSCDPFTSKSTPCTMGNYVDYAVKVSSSDDVIAAVNFARDNNIRFVIRNTGHDYFGRSTGAGALSVWMHHLNDVTYVDWKDSRYQGPSFKVSAGAMGFQVLNAAHARNLVVVGGECPTVGLAGGYIQGGGHSALSTSFGLGADQALQYEVVTASGKLVTASRSVNPELFWALSGGGAGNYGVVMSVTVKAYPDKIVGGGSLQFVASSTTPDKFFEAVAQFHALLPAMIDHGATVIYQMTSTFFAIVPVTAFGKTSDDVKNLLAPFVQALDGLGIPYQAAYTQSTSYYEHYEKYMGPLPYGHLGVGEFQYGGRLIPRNVLTNNAAGFAKVLRSITEQGVIAVGVGMDVSNPGDVSNAVFPALRKAAITMQIGTLWNSSAPWSQMLADQQRMTNEFVPQLEAVTPGSGTYQNEADFNQPHWRETFFGRNFFPLLSVKAKWDPTFLFYALKAVGSDFWTVDKSGRMCQTWSL